MHGVSEHIKFINNNSDVKTSVNNIDMSKNVIDVSFVSLIALKRSLHQHSIFGNESYHKLNFFCGRFICIGQMKFTLII